MTVTFGNVSPVLGFIVPNTDEKLGVPIRPRVPVVLPGSNVSPGNNTRRLCVFAVSVSANTVNGPAVCWRGERTGERLTH